MIALSSVTALPLVGFQHDFRHCVLHQPRMRPRASSSVWAPLSPINSGCFNSFLYLASEPESLTCGERTSLVRSVELLLENGDIDGAVSMIRHREHQPDDISVDEDIMSSTYHSVLEACCAGGNDQSRRRGRRSIDSVGTKYQEDQDRIEKAADLLKSMKNATAHAHEIIISGYARRGRWSDALKALESMEETFFPSQHSNHYTKKEEAGSGSVSVPSLNVYQSVLNACAHSGRFDETKGLLTRMRRIGVKPTIYTYNSLLKVCAQERSARWKEALSLLSQCQREPGVTPDLVSYTTAMRACARGRQPSKALKIFRVVKDMGITPDVYCYTTAMDACAKGKMWKTALSLLNEMKIKNITPSEVTYGVAITACGNGGQWQKALELLEEMREMKLKINTITYNSAISALAKAARVESKPHKRYDYKQSNLADFKQQQSTLRYPNSSDMDIFWREALKLIESMEKEGVARDSFTFSAAISTCGAAGRWEEAVDLMKVMQSGGVRGRKPNKIAYTSAITACGNSGKWEHAHELFNDMKRDGLRPDIVAYNALIGAGMTANQPDEVYNLWNEMCLDESGKISPDIVTLTQVIATLDRAKGKTNKERVDEVFTGAVQQGVILREDSLDSYWEVDLSGMSFPVARAACRFIFRRLTNAVKDGGEPIKSLSLITGASKMQEYIRGILREELTPAVYCIVPSSEKGTLHVTEKMMKQFIDGQRID